MNSEMRTCQNCKSPFTIEPEDFGFYEKMQVPPPTWCPECRTQRRLTYRNERSLYKRKCELCNTAIFSVYPPGSCVVYCVDCWSSDKWDATDYGLEYDWGRPFFKQWQELYNRVPQRNLQNINVTNSQWGGNAIRDCTRIYMSYSIIKSEDVLYSKDVDTSKRIMDSFDIVESENIYHGIFGYKNYNCFWVYNSRGCMDSYFLYDCANCKNCFLCTNLRNKEYCIRNKAYSKEEYFKKIHAGSTGSYALVQNYLREFSELISHSVHKYAKITNCVNCSGDELINSKNSHVCFSGHDLEDTKYTLRALFTKDAYDVSYGGDQCERIYESVGAGIVRCSNVQFNIHGALGGHSRNMRYVAFCGFSSNLFGCIGIRNKEYCILNKQYSKERYEETVTRIIRHMNDSPYVDARGRVYTYGEFFPAEISPFAYNETVAQEYFPLTRSEVARQGLRWHEPEEKHYHITLQPEDIPDRIEDADDSVLDNVIGCMHRASCAHTCTTAFRIVPQEIQMYRQMHLPLPRLCPNCRHHERLAKRNPLKLWHRACQCAGPKSENGAYKNTTPHQHGAGKCPSEFETSYPPDSPRIIYCEQCYNAEVV